jgi:hypothetical protein
VGSIPTPSNIYLYISFFCLHSTRSLSIFSSFLLIFWRYVLILVSGLFFLCLANQSSSTWAVRSVVVSLALHARGRGFNPHTVQYISVYIFLFFPLLSSCWKMAGALLLKFIEVNVDPQSFFSFTARAFSLGL